MRDQRRGAAAGANDQTHCHCRQRQQRDINSPGRGGVIIAHGDAVGDAPGVEAGVFSHRGPIGP
jgi:hypothetical protein